MVIIQSISNNLDLEFSIRLGRRAQTLSVLLGLDSGPLIKIGYWRVSVSEWINHKFEIEALLSYIINVILFMLLFRLGNKYQYDFFDQI